MREVTDELTALLVAGRDGDRLAFASWVRATQAEVARMCAHLVSPEQAEDLTQEAYLRAYRSLPSFRGDSSARTWLLSIARRTCVDAVRRLRRRRRFARLQQRPRPEPDPAGTVVLHVLLASLEPKRREAFVFTQVLGLTYEEAADACGCQVGTIRSRVARARADLMHQLQPTALTFSSEV